MTQLKNIDYIHFDSIDSTNKWAKKNIGSFDLSKMTCITASEQTEGYGRNQKKWHSFKDQSITATLVFTALKGASYLQTLAQVFALSTAKTLNSLGIHARLKWPNDVLVDEKKVAGILCELLDLNDTWGVVLGIGMNVNTGELLLRKIDQPATSLSSLSGGKMWDLQTILNQLLIFFLKDLAILKKDGFKALKSSYETLLLYRGEPIVFLFGKTRVNGIFSLIDNDGKLCITLPSKEVVCYTSGEIMTIRKE